MRNYQQNIGLALLMLINVIGVIGFRSESLLSLFKALTPYNLLFTLIICFIYLPRKHFFTPFVLLYTIGYGVEILGVKTGLLFGSYNYGSTLGIQLLNVPLIIGVNWFVLAIGARGCVNRITEKTNLQVLCAALLMVGLDFLIEPVAMKYDFWNWFQNEVPLQNYFMWFLVSISMQALLNKKSTLIPFSLGLAIIASQFIFFGVLLL
jgi:putative membrane protein